MELTIGIWAFFFSSLESGSTFYTSAYGVGLVFLLVYPCCLMVLLLKHQDILMEPKVKSKFDALYDFIDTNSKKALLYNPIFCMRRFYIVAINVILNAECPWTNFETNRYLYKIFFFLLLQSLYLFYIADTKPHLHTTFNRLEFLNEGALMALAYLMIAFSGAI